MHPTPYPDLNAVLQTLVESVREALGKNFCAAFLQGSFAVGDFDIHSDVDFIIATENELSDAEVETLQALHARIHNLECAWAQHLEGSYFPKSVLKDYHQRGKKLWYLDHGNRELELSDHCNTVVVRWVARAHGVSLAGPVSAALVDPIRVEVLREEILRTLCGWGETILTRPEEVNNRWYQTYIVLSFSRMLHDLHNGFPGSKRAGAEWAKATLEPSWNGLIDRAWAGRPNPALSCRQPVDPTDLQSTLEFVRYIMDASRNSLLSITRGF